MKKYLVMFVTNNQNILNRVLKALDWSLTEFNLFPIFMDPLGILEYVAKIKPHIITIQPKQSILDVNDFVKMCLSRHQEMQIVLIDEDGLLAEINIEKCLLLNNITKHEILDVLHAAVAKIVQQQPQDEARAGLIVLPEYYGGNPLVLRTIKYIESSYRQDIALSDITDDLDVSASHLSRVFKQELGCSVMQYNTWIRLREAQRLLLATKAKSTKIAELVGYSDYKYFSRLFKKECGLPPKVFRERFQKGEETAP